jgi:hypothetical protein
MSSFTERLIGAIRLDSSVHEDGEHDESAMAQAMTVVLVSSLASTLSTLRDEGLLAFLVGAISALIGWLMWAWVCQWVGTKLLPGPQTDADLWQVLRTTGFSAAPGVLRLLVIFPIVGPLFWVVGKLWMLVAMVVALKVALDYDSAGRAVAVCLVGFFVYLLV